MIIHFVAITSTFLIISHARDNDHFSEVITSEVGVITDQLKILDHHPNNAVKPSCQLTLHRTLCANPAITAHDTIGWDTRICFNWKCFNTSEYVMRVESCWVGSVHNPVYLIDERGCSLETSMIRSPRYNTNLTQAYSLGWLSVRLVGSKHIRLACNIRLCHICNSHCWSLTPPLHCTDNKNLTKATTIWNDKPLISSICAKPSKEEQRNKAAATSFSFLEIFGITCLALFTSWLFFH